MRVYGSISSTSLLHNLAIVKQHAGKSRIMAVIKANAYGHGSLRISKLLESKVTSFAVASVEEAVELRDAGIKIPICVLSGFLSPEHVKIFQAKSIDTVIYDSEQLHFLREGNSNQKLKIWVKFNTGMNRLGFSEKRLPSVLHHIESIPFVELRGLMSHFACADELDSDVTQKQIERFRQATVVYKTKLSLANSAAVLRWPDSHYDLVRPGLMLYGASPFEDISAAQLQLRPVMNLFSYIATIHDLKPNEGTGYGLSWRCEEPTRIGIVACGYGDGYHRQASPKAQVLVQERRANLVGRVSMDSFAINLNGHPDAKVGTPVKLFGDGLPVEEIAAATNTIAYEILTSISHRSVQLDLD